MYFMWPSFAGADPSDSTGSGPIVLPVSADRATLRAVLAELSIPVLESAWSCTDAELSGGVGTARRAALVDLRGLILDEVARRSSRRYLAWLRSGGPRCRASRQGLVVLG